jgi:hypothetical protein
MSRRDERRRERERQYEIEDEARRREQARKDALTMWERIEEAKDVSDMKEILHMLAQEMGLEA